MAPRAWIALMRGINVGGRNMIPMPDLQALCLDLGWQNVQTYIRSGNLVFRAPRTATLLEQEAEQAIERRFGFSIDVIVRDAAQWVTFACGNPFTEESKQEPNRVMLALAKRPPHPEAAARLTERAANGERIVQAGEALWLHFRDGAGQSKLTPSLLDRLVGSPVTMRNWRTVCTLQDMIVALPGK